MIDKINMCRLFGFKSVLTSQVHSSLVSADNALLGQSAFHPHGWGVAYYQENTPHLIKSPESALEDQLFKKVSGIVSSQTVLAHIRKATQGDISMLNTHPFQYGPWVFAHNGNIENFSLIKEQLIKRIDEDLAKYILGNTDSEVLFYFFISKIRKHFELTDQNIKLEKLNLILAQAVEEILEDFKVELCDSNFNPPDKSYITFILTNGRILTGFNGGQHLYYCTHKSKCPENDTCSFYNNTCEQKTSFGNPVNHLILSSEKMSGVNIWDEFKKGQFIGVDQEMNLTQHQTKIKFKTT